jgi:hypothetical protein
VPAPRARRIKDGKEIKKMAKYGRYASNGNLLQEYEGDSMAQNQEFVYIYEKAKSPNEVGQQVAAIHLDAGQSVKVIQH